MFGILQDALQNIESLELYYKSLIDHIKNEQRKGIKKNYIGAFAYRYFALIGMNDQEALKSVPENMIKLIEASYDNIKVMPVEGEDESFKVVYTIKSDSVIKAKHYEEDARKAVIQFHHFSEMHVLHADNALIMLITRFEEYIAQALKYLFKCFPEQYLNNQTITFSELDVLSHDDIVDLIIQRQVDKKMWEEYKVWLKEFENHGFSFSNCKQELDLFNEMYYRRNVIIHNSGLVNGTYLRNVPDSKLQIGDSVHVTPEYIDKRFQTMRILIISIALEAARLLNEEQRKGFYNDVFLEIFQFLENEEYNICERVYPQIASNKEVEFELKLLSKINAWIAKKENGKFGEVKKEIEKFDFSALEKRYKCAREFLLNNYDDGIRKLEELFPNTFSPHQIETWPLFKSFRETQEYTSFREKHKELFNQTEADVENNNDDDNIYKNIPVDEVIS